MYTHESGVYYFCYLRDYSWLGMTESSVYELNLSYVLESIIITVVRIQGFTTRHTVCTQNYFSVFFRQGQGVGNSGKTSVLKL